jgi:phi LC3 family holin
MKINWKVRFKNPVFITQVLLSVFVPVMGYYGMTAQDFTTWQSMFDLLKNAISNPYVVGMMIVGLWNALNDPTTRNLRDSDAALKYKQPK